MGAISKVLISRVGSVEFMFRMLGKSMRRRALSLARSIGHYFGPTHVSKFRLPRSRVLVVFAQVDGDVQGGADDSAPAAGPPRRLGRTNARGSAEGRVHNGCQVSARCHTVGQ